MWRRVAICFSFGILCLVQGWALPSTTPAQGRVDSSGGRATGLPDIPEACKTPRMRPEAPAEVPRNEVESQGLSAEAYESLGTFYGREGQFSCRSEERRVGKACRSRRWAEQAVSDL